MRPDHGGTASIVLADGSDDPGRAPAGRRAAPAPADVAADGDRPASPTSRTPRDELAETTAHGALYLQRLRQRQLTLSLLALVAFGALIGVLPLAIDLLPQLRRIHLLGIPVAIWLRDRARRRRSSWRSAVLYARRADALDESFRELVRRR